MQNGNVIGRSFLMMDNVNAWLHVILYWLVPELDSVILTTTQKWNAGARHD